MRLSSLWHVIHAEAGIHFDNPEQEVVVECKAFEPRTHIILPTIGHCMTVINELNRSNMGINIDMGHALIMKESLAE